ncbi:AIPR family protein [Amycolatopsis sp. NPDC051716]|uniref:AIPR family protein n=1 Tax=Amycolatopsis sp. NPDC051716 TaxID=3155804 RepID=UPI00342F0844
MNPLVQGLFNKFKQSEELESLSDSDAFELFAASILLPDYLLSQAERTDFLLDPGAIGVDVVALEVNSQLVWDKTDASEICDGTNRLEVSLHLIQAKKSAGVSSSEILNFGDAALKILNNSVDSAFQRLVSVAGALSYIFENHAAKLKSPPAVALHFTTTAPRVAVEDSTVVDRVETVRGQISSLGFVGRVSVRVHGADDLHDLWTKKNVSNEVEIQLEKSVNLPKMQGVTQGIIGVVSVSELLRLVENDEGSLDERVFYDNVRGFQGTGNSVNKQIISTLASDDRNLLPVLNNGVTVVASSYFPKPGDAMSLSGYQIVNGGQTSHCAYLSKEHLGDNADSTYVPIRIVVTEDADIATKITQATNSQTEVKENDLVALNKFQKRLEDFYRIDTEGVSLTYERRSGQFFGREVTKTRLVSISDQMRALSAVFLDSPHVAARYPKQLYNEVGSRIFQDDHKLIPYVASAFAAYKLENAFRTVLEAFYKPARYHILMVYAYQALGHKAAPLKSAKVEEDSRKLIAALKRPDQVSYFRQAAAVVVEVAGGNLRSSDQLKRSQLTLDLLKKFNA